MVEYLDFDLAGHPKKTRQTRYKDGTGLTSKQVLDSFEQVYGWNVHGERISWTMPRPAAFSPIDGWTDTVFEDHDAAGNITTITRRLFGSTAATSLMTASFRNAGRPTQRTVTTNCVGLMVCAAKTIERGYGYDASTSQLNEMVAKVGTTPVAGSHAGFDGLQIKDIQLLGVSGDTRHSRYTYDVRSRLSGSVLNTTDPAVTPAPGVPGSASLAQTPADFVSSVNRTPTLDPATRALLVSKGVDVSRVDPGTTTLTEAPGHKIATVEQDGRTSAIATPQSQRTGDAKYLHTWGHVGTRRGG